MIGVGYYPSWFTVFTALFDVRHYGHVASESLMTLEEMLILGGVALIVGLVVFILQGIGLYKLGKRAGIGKKTLAMAFLPFVNLMLVGKIVGEISFFGKKLRRLGLYAMLAEIVSTAYCLVLAYAMYVLFIQNGASVEILNGYYTWNGLEGAAIHWKAFYDAHVYIEMIVGLVYAVLVLVLMLSFFRRYTARMGVLFSLLTVMVPCFREIIIFVFRNRELVDYAALYRARQEEIRRRQQQQQQQWGNGPYGPDGPYGGMGGSPYGNPYGNPYGTQNGGNASGNSQTATSAEPEDPFGEFSETPKDDGDPFQ